MRIAMIAPFGIRPKGTLSARMLPLAQELMRRGHLVQIVAPPLQNPEDAGTSIDHAGVVVAHTRLGRMPGPAGFAEQVWLLRQHALALQPDVVHLFKPKGFGGLAVLNLPATLPLVIDSDDWEGWGGWNDLLPYPIWAKWLFAWQEYDLPRRAQAVTAVSQVIACQMLGFGVAAERLFYLPNGIRLPAIAYQHAAEPPVPRTDHAATILLYTRFWEFELPFLMQVLQHVASEWPAARLLVVGRGENGEERDMLRLAEAAQVSHMIDYRGWAAPEAIAGLMAEAQIAIVPISDTLLNRARGLAKLLELMAAGLPIVASRVGQVAAYLVDLESGLLVPPNDAAAMAAKISLLLANAQLRSALANGARARSALFSWDRLAIIAEQAYTQALNTPQRAKLA